jgi:glycosyltransferase involved in cell wall biosynthesis
VREFPAARLAIAGGGNDRARLEKIARDLGVSAAVEFKGFVSEEEKVELYNRASVFVNPSLKEGWGLTSIEANACGTPVVAADSPGLRDSVRHGETGMLAAALDPRAFASAIASILRDPAEAERLREGALAWAKAHDWERAYETTREAVLDAWRRKAA